MRGSQHTAWLHRIQRRHIILKVLSAPPLVIAGTVWNRYIQRKAIIENMEAPQKIKNRIMMWFSNPSSGNLSDDIEISILKRYLHSCVYFCIIDSSQDTKTT